MCQGYRQIWIDAMEEQNLAGDAAHGLLGEGRTSMQSSAFFCSHLDAGVYTHSSEMFPRRHRLAMNTA